MKKWSVAVLFIMIFCFCTYTSGAQCSICTKTAQQMGEKPAQALNLGIVYLAFAPIAIFSIIGYKWYKNNR